MLSHLRELEADSIHVIREVVAEFARPVLLYSIGKDSQVLLHLARKAFHPAPVPVPLLHVDTTWKFREMYAFRDRMVRELGLRLVVHRNQRALDEGINPFDHSSQKYTFALKTQALLEALAIGGYDAAFGGARRDEEKSRAKERIFSFRDRHGQWEPRQQRPELWNLYNSRIEKGESIRVFPLSNWSELDVWQYVQLEGIPVVPLYFAADRPVVEREGNLIVVPLQEMETAGEPRELVRLVVIGSVDDGKSTLIGRLLYETGALFDDQIEQVRRATRNGDAIDFSLFTDGLKAEREQGITID